MHHHGTAFNPLLRTRDCVSCPDQIPACNCSSGYDCVLTVETCDACPVAQCVARPKKNSSGVSKSAMAGAVVAVLAFLLLIVGGFLWWRRRSSKRRMAAASREKAVENVPGSRTNASSPINPRFSRPLDTYEKAPGPMENPFETDSIRSGNGSAHSAHSIPIGLASDGQLSPSATSPTGTTFTGVPTRPARGPDLNIRATPFDRPAGNATLKPPRPGYAPSSRTDISTSTMDSTASSAMEALYESPTIVTGVKRTVISAGRGEVVTVSDLGSNPNSPRGSTPLRRQAGPSPLAQSHFSRSTLAPMAEEDPFVDDGMSLRSQSTAMTNMTFGMGTPTASIRSFQPTVASRVNVASLTRSATLKSLGTASLAPSVASTPLDHPLADEILMYPPQQRRESVDSFASNTDSVLASFPFVPPSPLPTSSSRSPLSVVFNNNPNRQSAGSSMFGIEPISEHPPPLPDTHDIASLKASTFDAQQTQPQSRFATPAEAAAAVAERERGSNVMSGLDEFDFQFTGNDAFSPAATSQPQLRSDSMTLPKNEISPVPSRKVSGGVPNSAASHGRTESRASLDTLELSRDLAANKLAYDD